MSYRSRRVTALLFVAALVFSVVPAPAVARADDDPLARAKALFHDGVQRFEANDLPGAFDAFSRSRQTFPSIENTLNAAISADRLQRKDVALGLYDALVAEFWADLSAGDRAAVTRAVGILLHEVASLEIAANVAGTVYIDGEAKDRLPQAGPLRVMPGKHAVRIGKGGYATYEREVVVLADQRRHIDARLEPLEGMGELRVEDTDSPGSELFVDGRSVGTTPWEGALAPGKHVLFARKGETGSAPEKFTVLQGQAALVRVRARPLGVPLAITVKPAEAVVSVDGVPLGAGPWRGRLPVGVYAVTVEAPGYRVRQGRLRVTAGGSDRPASRERYELEVDRDSPRWLSAKDADRDRWFLGASLGFPLLLGSDFTFCDSTCLAKSYVRGLTAIRGGYRYRGLGLEAEAGALSLGAGGTSRYWSMYVAGAMSFRMPITAGLGVLPRITLGKAFNAQTSGAAAEQDSAGTVLFRAELGPELEIGDAHLSVSMAFVSVEKVNVVAPQMGVEWAF